jgi:hypothetical protein
MPDFAATVISPDLFAPIGEMNPFPVENFEQRYLAQGDSWFSLGALPPRFTTNLLQEMVLARSTLVVNCARPSQPLSLMTDTTQDPKFLDLLCRPRVRRPWDALLISGGGNDVIAAALVPGQHPQALRLLLRADEWGPQREASRYVSEPGWQTFSDHISVVFELLMQRRAEAVHPEMPVVLHPYDHVTPRNAPAGPGIGPWLYKAMNDLYGIPPQDRNGLSDLIINRLVVLLQGLADAYPNVTLIEAVGTLRRADAKSTGVDRDWEDEIHPTPSGYAKLGRKWRPTLDGLPRLDPV